jgi:hypothetical protein
MAIAKPSSSQCGIPVLHFCGYENEPTADDRKILEEELNTDPTFELVGRLDVDVFIVEAPKEIVEAQKERMIKEYHQMMEKAYATTPTNIHKAECQEFDMEPHMYDGESCDLHRPRWMTSYPKHGKEEDGETLEINLPAHRVPPGTRIAILIPCCPICGDPADINEPGEDEKRLWPNCNCGFDWNKWAEGQYS